MNMTKGWREAERDIHPAIYYFPFISDYVNDIRLLVNVEGQFIEVSLELELSFYFYNFYYNHF